jgi:hypothetical protein
MIVRFISLSPIYALLFLTLKAYLTCLARWFDTERTDAEEPPRDRGWDSRRVCKGGLFFPDNAVSAALISLRIKKACDVLRAAKKTGRAQGRQRAVALQRALA